MSFTVKNTLLLLRGLPGCGKSELAKILSDNSRHPSFSIDDYFVDDNGVYQFDHSKNHLAYKACEENVIASMKNNSPLIIVHHTFTIDWEMELYFKLAKEFDYNVHVATVENYHGSKNIHHISEEQLQKMAMKYKVKLL